MKRHTEFQYCIGRIEKSSSIWIFIEDNKSGWNKEVFDWTSDEQYAGPIELLKRIQEREHWTIKRVGELQYGFDEDPYNIVYQMDDLFGFVAIINDVKQYDKVLAFIKKYVLQNPNFPCQGGTL